MAYLDPSIARARECREAMDGSLRTSIRKVLGRDGPTGDLDGPRKRPNDLLDYGAYFDLTLKLADGSAVSDAAKEAARAYLDERFAADGLFGDSMDARPVISNLSADCYSDVEIARMQRWWDMERESAIELAAATPEEFARTSEAIGQALDHLEAADPELYGETCALVNEIVLAHPDGADFGGITSFGLWGAFTLNARNFNIWPTCYGKIVHEAGHNLLFAYARQNPLVSDDPASRAYSHIRDEDRPFDGIFHAAFVSAREAYAFDRLLVRNDREAILSDEECALIEVQLTSSVNGFWGCAETVRRDGHVTALGDEILAECEAYMRENFSFADA
ncbi:MAG: HEXXH motif-containing putative peptide modification protein [Sphingomonadaceae bacterium]